MDLKEGQSLVETLALLRGWQCQPQPKVQGPIDLILAERDRLLARRARALKEGAEGQA